MNKESLKKQLHSEGFPHIFEWHDEPGTKYPVHAHKGAVAFYVLEGEVTFQFGTLRKTIKKGERFDAPIAEMHSAEVGPQGCDFLVGEMIEGDA